MKLGDVIITQIWHNMPGLLEDQLAQTFDRVSDKALYKVDVQVSSQVHTQVRGRIWKVRYGTRK